MKNFDHPDQDQGWLPCQPGLISELNPQKRLPQSLSRRQFVHRSLKIGFASTLAVGAIGLMRRNATWGDHSKMLNCAEVQKHLTGYIAGKVNDSDLVDQIAQHLAKCEPCRKKHETLLAQAQQLADRSLLNSRGRSAII